MTTHEIVKKIVGPVYPIGETSTDDVRFVNLEEMCSLVNKLLYDIQNVSLCKTSQEHSVSNAGKYAADFLKQVKEADL